MAKVNFLILGSMCNDSTNYNFTKNKLTSVTHRLLGPYKLARQARAAGYTCQIIDFIQFIPDETLYSLIDKFVDKNTLIGMSLTHLVFYQVETDPLVQKLVNLIEYIKKKHNSKILIGGSDCYLWKSFLNIDYILEGKSENTIQHMLDSILNNGIQKKRLSTYNIDTCDFKYHLSDNIQTYECLPLETSRGCIFKCKFCSFEGIGKRPGTLVRDLLLVKDELIYNYETWGITNYQILDETFNDDPERIEQWAKMSQSLPFKLAFTAHIRGDLVDKNKETAFMLVEAGMRGCHIGVETLHKKASKAIAKPWSGTHAKEWIPEIKQGPWKNVNTTVNMILGLPYEPVESMVQTLYWSLNNKLSTVFYSYGVYANSAQPNASYIQKNYKDYGIEFDENNMWYTDITDRLQMTRLRDNFNLKISKSTPPDSWDTNLLTGYGYDLDEMLSMNKKDLYDDPVFEQRQTAFIQKYIDSLNAIP